MADSEYSTLLSSTTKWLYSATALSAVQTENTETNISNYLGKGTNLFRVLTR